MDKIYFEDWHVGDRVVTSSRTINETDVAVFAALTGDWNPLHTDPEYANTTTFGERIIHGQLSLSIGAGLLMRALNSTPLAKFIPTLWAIEKARFIAPSKVGDTVHVESEVVNLTGVDEKRGLVTIHQRMKNQRGEDVLLSTCKILVGRRPPA